MQPKRVVSLVAFMGFLMLLFSSPIVAQAQIGNPQRGIGISITFPFPFLPTAPATTSATFFLNLLAQGQISQELAHRLELRFFFDAAGFQTSLTSVRESLLVLFTPAPAVFYIGGGAGTYPIRVPAVPSDGFLLSLLLRTGVEVQVFPLGLFLDIAYETMPQPFVDIAGGTFTPGTISALELTFGALIHF
jgi:hypothetical protein